MSKENAVGWFEIYVEDMDRAKKFYETVFQRTLENLPMDDGPQMYMFTGENEAAGAQGALVKMDGSASGKNSVLVYFNCDDCAIEEARAKENGGKIIKPKFSIGENGFISLFTDSEGNMIGLYSKT